MIDIGWPIVSILQITVGNHENIKKEKQNKQKATASLISCPELQCLIATTNSNQNMCVSRAVECLDKHLEDKIVFSSYTPNRMMTYLLEI